MFMAQVNTTGYVGFGLSPVGKMNPADIMIAWIHDNQVYPGDYHTKGDRAPIIDKQQDWQLIAGSEIDNVTTIVFMRLLDTCDVDDVVITTDTMQVIYGYHDDDPDLTTGMVPYHGINQRGSVYIQFMSLSIVPAIFPPNNTFLINFTNSMYPIPVADVSRICIVFNMSVIFPRSHLVKYEPLITPGNEPYVHRMNILRCDMRGPDTTNIDRKVFDCQKNAPSVVKACRSIVVAWARGGEAVYFDQDTGISLGGPEDPTMYVLEIQYTNRIRLPYMIDNSGIRLTYTTTLRSYEAAFLELGNIITPGLQQFIPPGEPHYTSSAYCSRRCMGWGYNPQNITIYAIGVLLHGSDITSSIRLRHLRNDRLTMYELPWIADDKTFSSRYQPMRMFRIPVAIDKDDILYLECSFNTTGRMKIIKGGWSEDEAICRASVLYFPKIQMDMCLSWTSFDKLKTEGGQTVPENRAVRYLNSIKNWSSNPIMKRHLRMAERGSSQRSLCTSQNRTPAYALDRSDRPNITQPYQKQTNACPRGG